MSLILVRHGETEWSRTGRHTGRTDVDLTARGEGEARGLESVLSMRSVARVLTSPMRRARRTAELAGFPDAEISDLLREVDYGDYEGLTTPQIREEVPGWELFKDGCPGGEPFSAAAVRVGLLFKHVEDADGDVLVFAHGHILRILGARWIGAPAEWARHLKLEAGAVSILGHLHGVATIDVWNHHPYLDGEAPE